MRSSMTTSWFLKVKCSLDVDSSCFFFLIVTNED